MSEEIEENDNEFGTDAGDGKDHQLQNVVQVSGMYNEWFLDYASYVILERAVPHLHDGLKPVQRRILHSLYELEDGRFHKVANVIGNTMKYHPHGDASIGDAMVQVGQKNILLDIQGNWGNIYTGDRAAAPRYIEVRLSKFSKDVLFNPKVTQWLLSYDGRGKEPRTLPVKFPLLLAQGAEGIAVGLACKILPHNFIELIDASIDILKGKKASIYPDFPTGGMMDPSAYNDGLRGSRVRVRAKIRKEDNKTLIINDIPFGTTTSSLIDSILKANEKGKIKVRKIEDNTAEHVEIVVHLAAGVSPDKTIDALYAFSDCEVSIAPNACVIENDRPRFVGVTEMLKISTERTKDLLRQELEIRKSEMEEQWHFSSLEKIFIEKRIYRNIEECETWEAIIATIHKGLKPHVKKLMRVVTDEDVARLTEIKIKRISRFDAFKADEKIRSLEGAIVELTNDLNNLTEYTIAYFKDLKERYGKGRERKTEIKPFDTIDRTGVAVANEKLYVNKEEGFIGTGLKRGEGEFISDCSDIDDVIVFRNDGTMLVTKVSQKAFVGKGIIHAQVWKKGDDRTIYNCIYRDGKQGKVYMKRFPVTAITRDKEYPITKGTNGSELLYFSANPNGEAEVVSIILKPLQRLRKLKFDVDFAVHAIKGRAAQGNIISRYPVRKVELKEKGISTLGARQIYYDETIKRLNADSRGRYLGDFRAEDKIMVILSSGVYKLLGFDLSTHFDENMISLEKWEPEKPVTAIYFDGEKQTTYVKRFLPEYATKEVNFISEGAESQLVLVSTLFHPKVILRFNKKFKNTRDREDELINLTEYITIKGVKAQGNKLSNYAIAEVEIQQPDAKLEAASQAQFKSEQEAKRKEENPALLDDDDFEDEDPGSILFDIELPPVNTEKRKKRKAAEDDEDEVQPTLF